MQFRLKNDDGIELHLSLEERELIYKALRHFSGYSDKESYVLEQMGNICEIMNVIYSPDFRKC